MLLLPPVRETNKSSWWRNFFRSSRLTLTFLLDIHRVFIFFFCFMLDEAVKKKLEKLLKHGRNKSWNSPDSCEMRFKMFFQTEALAITSSFNISNSILHLNIYFCIVFEKKIRAICHNLFTFFMWSIFLMVVGDNTLLNKQRESSCLLTLHIYHMEFFSIPSHKITESKLWKNSTMWSFTWRLQF